MGEIKLIKQEGKGRSVIADQVFELGEKVLTFQGIQTNQQGRNTVQIEMHIHLNPDSPGCYVNHSCDPNCGIRNSTTLVAMRPIHPGEEITFDYAMTEQQLSMPFECVCETPTCRGRIGGYVELPSAIRERYTGFIADYLLNP